VTCILPVVVVVVLVAVKCILPVVVVLVAVKCILPVVVVLVAVKCILPVVVVLVAKYEIKPSGNYTPPKPRDGRTCQLNQILTP
jgi:hypothetical protein